MITFSNLNALSTIRVTSFDVMQLAESFCGAAICVKRDATNARQGKIEKLWEPSIPLASNPVAETIIPVIIDVWLNAMKERLVHLVRLLAKLHVATQSVPKNAMSHVHLAQRRSVHRAALIAAAVCRAPLHATGYRVPGDVRSFCHVDINVRELQCL